jgi:hypothetical protein
MGDRAYLEMWVRAKDVGKVVEACEVYSEFAEPEIVDGLGKLIDIESNYTKWDERAELAAKGVLFHGMHAAGDNYGPMVFVSDGERMWECDADCDGMPVVEYTRAGLGDTAPAQRYWAMRKEVERIAALDA